MGVAISDEMRITVRPLPAIERGSWKNLLQAIERIVVEYDVCALVIGLPLRLEGGEGKMAMDVRGLAEKFGRSLSIPIYLQDERLTSVAAAEKLRDAGQNRSQIARQVDSESAAIILSDFINQE